MRRVKVRGGKRMKEKGCKRVEVWLDPNELGLIQGAAVGERKRLATYIREKAYRAAEELARNRRRQD